MNNFPRTSTMRFSYKQPLQMKMDEFDSDRPSFYLNMIKRRKHNLSDLKEIISSKLNNN